MAHGIYRYEAVIEHSQLACSSQWMVVYLEVRMKSSQCREHMSYSSVVRRSDKLSFASENRFHVLAKASQKLGGGAGEICGDYCTRPLPAMSIPMRLTVAACFFSVMSIL